VAGAAEDLGAVAASTAEAAVDLAEAVVSAAAAAQDLVEAVASAGVAGQDLAVVSVAVGQGLDSAGAAGRFMEADGEVAAGGGQVWGGVSVTPTGMTIIITVMAVPTIGGVTAPIETPLARGAPARDVWAGHLAAKEASERCREHPLRLGV